MALFHSFHPQDAPSIDQRGGLLRKRIRGISQLHLAVDAAFIMKHRNTIEPMDESAMYSHQFIRRLNGNATIVDEAEQGSPTTVAIVSIVLFIFVISLFFLLSCCMWCHSYSGSSFEVEETSDDVHCQMSPEERSEYLHRVLETKTFALQSVENDVCTLAEDYSLSPNDDPSTDVDCLRMESLVNMTPDAISLDEGKQQCAICLENFMEGDRISTSILNVECRHQFHQPCIMEWCMKQSDCPCCRRDLLFLSDVTTVDDNFDSYRSDFTRGIAEEEEEE